jgi:aspartyl-tRNA synthetase
MSQSEMIAVIERILKDLSQPSFQKEIEYQVVMDKERHHYQVIANGWVGNKRTYGMIVHIDIKDGLIWVQEENTDYGVVDEMLRAGISKDKIVLGFHAPYKRPYTGFATGE